jgi:hypothetical protein
MTGRQPEPGQPIADDQRGRDTQKGDQHADRQRPPPGIRQKARRGVADRADEEVVVAERVAGTPDRRPTREE